VNREGGREEVAGEDAQMGDLLGRIKEGGEKDRRREKIRPTDRWAP
jgi:hypothetical protein